MICLSPEWFPRKKPGLIRLRMPRKVTIIRGCKKERIEAIEDERGRLAEMVIYTKSRTIMRVRNVQRWY